MAEFMDDDQHAQDYGKRDGVVDKSAHPVFSQKAACGEWLRISPRNLSATDW